MSANKLITERLAIIPMTYKVVRSILNGTKDEMDRLRISTNGKWPRQDTLDILQFIEGSMDKGEEPSGFDVWMIVKKEDMTIIGDAGFKGEPDESGEVEIGYGLIEEEHGKGFGYEAVSELIRWAFSREGVKKVKADCLIENHASIGLLKKCGMKEILRDTEMIYWELEREALPE